MENNLTDTGQELPIAEEFYSLQGEGIQTGRAAYFIRIGGCDVACEWCDTKETWNPMLFPPKPTEEVIRRVLNAGTDSVVVTGGEPLTWNLNVLCEGLKANQILTFLETSGSQPLSGFWDWICLSPKKNSPPLSPIFRVASELKVIIHDPTDFSWAEENAARVNPSTHLLLQPEWSRRDTMTPLIVEYIKRNPRWRLSLQAHKFIRIP